MIKKILKFKFRIAIIVFFFIYATLFIFNADIFVRSDGWYYYHTAKCMVDQGSFVCSKEPTHWNYMDLYTKNQIDGKYISVTAPGTAIVYYPALLVAKMLSGEADLQNDYFLAYNGHTLLDGIVILITSLTLNLLSLLFVFKILREFGFSRKVSFVSIILISISTFIFWYAFMAPIYSHVAEVFFVTLILYSFVKFCNKKKNFYLYLMIFSIGFSILIRPILLPVGTLFVLGVFLNLFQTDKKTFLKKIIQIVLVSFFIAIPFLLVYFHYNQISYGTLVTSGYSSARNESFIGEFNGHNILFSIHRGWFIYSPLIIFSIFGLVTLFKRNKILSSILVLSIFSIVTIYGFWPNWWGGGSFGSRFLLFSFPFCVLGMALFLNKVRTYGKFLKKVILGLLIIFFVHSEI